MVLTAPTPIRSSGAGRLFAVNARAPALMIAEFAHRKWSGLDPHRQYRYRCRALFPFGNQLRSQQARGRFGITLNTVSLGLVEPGWLAPELERAVRPAIPLGWVGTAREIAVWFLLAGGGHAM